MQENAPFD